MATRDSGYQIGQKSRGARGSVIKWAGLSQDDDGQWRLLTNYRDKCLHVFGNFSGAIVTFEGTNEEAHLDNPANQVPLRKTLTDPMQQFLIFSSPDIAHVLENPLYVRPKVTGGDVNTDITVLLVCRH